MLANLANVSYIGATILFILSLGGLSNPESSRRGNFYGIIGMTIAVLATVFGPRVTLAGIPWIIGAMVIGGGIGLYAARKVQMTQMPELVALMHSLVGLAAVFRFPGRRVVMQVAVAGATQRYGQVVAGLGAHSAKTVADDVMRVVSRGTATTAGLCFHPAGVLAVLHAGQLGT